MRLVPYIRVSTTDQADAYGPEVQRQSIAASGHTIVGQWHMDSMSGATDADDRPALMAAIEEAKALKADGLIAYRRDRYARDAVVMALLTRHVEKAFGGKLYSADGVGNGEDGVDILMRSIMDGFAQYERWLIKARTSAGKRASARQGHWHGGEPPYGYRLKEGGGLEIADDEAQVVRFIFESRDLGHTFSKICSVLGAKTRCGGTFQPGHLSRIIARRAFYEGRDGLTDAGLLPGVEPDHPVILSGRTL